MIYREETPEELLAEMRRLASFGPSLVGFIFAFGKHTEVIRSDERELRARFKGIVERGGRRIGWLSATLKSDGTYGDQSAGNLSGHPNPEWAKEVIDTEFYVWGHTLRNEGHLRAISSATTAEELDRIAAKVESYVLARPQDVRRLLDEIDKRRKQIESS